MMLSHPDYQCKAVTFSASRAGVPASPTCHQAGLVFGRSSNKQSVFIELVNGQGSQPIGTTPFKKLLQPPSDDKDLSRIQESQGIW